MSITTKINFNFSLKEQQFELHWALTMEVNRAGLYIYIYAFSFLTHFTMFKSKFIQN